MQDYPNPDLAIEVDIYRPGGGPSRDLRRDGRRRVWSFDGQSLTIERLDENGRYQTVERSGFLPVRADQVPRWLIDEDLSDYEAWIRRVRAWVYEELRE